MLLRISLLLLLNVAAFHSLSFSQEVMIASEPKAAKPLEVGAPLPDVQVTSTDGKSVTLAELNQDKSLVIVFFRGGWCPICSRHTQELIKIQPELKQKGFEMIAISPDTPDNSAANVKQNTIPFPVYSDSELQAISAFGLAFKVDDATVTKYKGFGIDLEKASGRPHHALPIPAIYVVDREGKITFAHSNPDYTKRLDPQELLRAISK